MASVIDVDSLQSPCPGSLAIKAMPATELISGFSARFAPYLERCLETQALNGPYAAPDPAGCSHAPWRAQWRQTAEAIAGCRDGGRFRRSATKRPCARRWRSNSFTVSRWSMTICRPWTMTISGAASRPFTRPSTRRRRFWPGCAAFPGLRPDLAAENDPLPIRPCCLALDPRTGDGDRAPAAWPAASSSISKANWAAASPTPRSPVMQQMKTGALIRAAVRMGALIGSAGPDAHRMR